MSSPTSPFSNEEAIAASRTRLDQPTHGLAVADERTELDVAGIGMRVEVQDRHSAPAASARHAGDVGPGDGVIPAEDERHGPGLGDALHDDLEVRAGARGISAVHLHVAAIDDAQVREPVGVKCERGA